MMNETRQIISYTIACEPNEDTGKPVILHRLIRVLAVRLNIHTQSCRKCYTLVHISFLFEEAQEEIAVQKVNVLTKSAPMVKWDTVMMRRKNS